jgi:hypothetical protein
MVTLSAFVVLFGVPLSLWLTYRSNLAIDWWLLLLLIILAALLGAFLPLLLGAGAFLLTALFLFWMPPFVVERLPILLTLLATILLLAQLSYRSAVQAALAYGEQIKTTFDLYRRQLLDALHLQLPTNLTDERKLWTELGGLIYRGNEPDPRFYRYIQKEDAKVNLSPIVHVPAPAVALPAYHVITSAQLMETEASPAEMPADAIRDPAYLTDKLTLRALPAGKPVSHSWVADPAKLAQKVILGIPATPAMVLGGEVSAGSVVDIHLVAVATPGSMSPAPDCFENIFVVTVNSVSGTQTPQFVCVIALPEDKLEEFIIAHSKAGAVTLTCKPTRQ